MSIATTAGAPEKNIALAFQFVRELFDHPERIDAIPDGATVVVIPDGDQAQRDLNLQLGMDLVRSGTDVYFVHDRVNELATATN